LEAHKQKFRFALTSRPSHGFSFFFLYFLVLSFNAPQRKTVPRQCPGVIFPFNFLPNQTMLKLFAPEVSILAFLVFDMATVMGVRGLGTPFSI